MASSYSDTGIIVKTQDYKEADKIISIITENHGLTHYVAVGARKSTSRKSSHLDLLSLIKFSTNVSGGQNYLLQADSVNFFSTIKGNLQKIGLSLSFLEILYHLLPAESDDREVFTSLVNYLNALNQKTSREVDGVVSRKFASYLLRHLGYPPPPVSSKNNLSSYFEILMNRKIIAKEIS